MSSERGGRYVVISKKQTGVAERVRYNAQEGIALGSGRQVKMHGAEEGVKFAPAEPIAARDAGFDIRLSLNTEERTFVPLGIPAYDGELENSFFYFNYSLLGGPVSSLNFRIVDEAGRVLHNHSFLEEIVVTARRLPEARRNLRKREPIPTWQPFTILQPFRLEPPDYTRPGDYGLLWDGFDMDGVYDSAAIVGKTLTAVIIAEKAGQIKRAEVRFRVEADEVDWVDVKILKASRRIETTLRLELTDGGAEGLGRHHHRDPLDDPRMPSRERADWERVPPQVIAANGGRPPLQARIRQFADLENLALRGVQYHWGRNAGHAVAKNVRIGGEAYEVVVNPVNTTDRAMDNVALTFNTNGPWMRSGNPGTVDDPVSFVGNLVSREAVAYNAGYIRRGSRWSYDEPSAEDVDFRFTAAHEIGHSILKAYGGTAYSYGHKGSVHVVTQTMKDDAPPAPASGEVDIMPYYPNSVPLSQYNRYAAAEADALGLIWLTKLRIDRA